jgi:uncharacterized membrane protein YdbT with pleckstrin-like domain
MFAPDPKLISGETVVYSSSKHWASLLTRSIWAIALIALAIVLGWIQPEATTGILGFMSRTIELLRLGLFLGGLGWIAYNVVAWRTAEYAVTNRRVLGHEGLLRQRSTDALLTSVSDIRTLTPVLGRMLNYGNVRIITAAGDSGKEALTSIRDAEQFKHQVLEQKAGRAAISPTPADGPVDIPQLVGYLTTLRAAGVLTEAEYQTKRDALLARI